MVEGAQSHLKSNLIPARDAWRVQTKPCEHQDRGTGAVILTRHRARPAFECLVSCRGMGQQWPAPGTGAPTAAFLQTQHVAQVLLEEAAISPTKAPPALLGGGRLYVLFFSESICQFPNLVAPGVGHFGLWLCPALGPSAFQASHALEGSS